MNTEQASATAPLAVVTERSGSKLTVSQMDVPDVVAQVETIRQIMENVMQEGMHYGRVPGTDKPTLLLPGAQKLGMTFRFRVSYPKVEQTDIPNNATIEGELPRPPHREYQVVCRIEDGSGNFMGEGVGLCSTLESKYRFRKHENYEVTQHTVPQSYWKLKDRKDKQRLLAQIMDDVSTTYGTKKVPDGPGGQWFIVKILDEEKVEYPNPADYYNTVLKIGKKRAFVDAILTVTAAGDLFTQDLEDLDANRSALAEETGKQWEENESKTSAEPKKDTAPKGKGAEKKSGGEKYTAPKNWRENYIHFESTLKGRKLGTLTVSELELVRDKWIQEPKFWGDADLVVNGKKTRHIPTEQDKALKKSVLDGLAALKVPSAEAQPAKEQPATPAPTTGAEGDEWDAVKYATQITDYLADKGISEPEYFEILRRNLQIPDGGEQWTKIDDVDNPEWLKHAAITIEQVFNLDAVRQRQLNAPKDKTDAPPGTTEPAQAAPEKPPKKKRAPRKRKGGE